MRKKYAAVVLGLTLSISQAGIFGAGLTVNAASEAAEDTEESTDTETQTDEEKTPGDEDKKEQGTPKKGDQQGEPAEKPDGVPPQGNPGGQSSGVDSYSAVKDYTEDAESEKETFASTGKDENSVHISEGAKVVLDEAEISRKSEESTGGDNSSFYGVGAAVLDTEITTKKDTSGGIHVAGGGTLYAWDMDIETEGESSAAVRSDRGGGTMVIDGGSYTSNGVGSPVVYSTADISINNAELTANGSEAVCIEGMNTVRLFDSDLTGNMSDLEQNDCTWNVILYQSMSGDSEIGNSTFEMTGGSVTAGNGGMFYTTNTESTITLSGVDIVNADDSEFFLRCTGNSNERGWGTAGENGADCLFTGIQQQMQGDVIWDSISNLDFYMTEGSTLEGAVVDDESKADDGGDGYCNFYIGEDCTWTVTGDSTLSRLFNAGNIVDKNGETVTVKGTDGTVYQEGSGSCTITVDSYSEDADLSGAAKAGQWSDYQVEKPEELI